jgi:hypothetical protein
MWSSARAECVLYRDQQRQRWEVRLRRGKQVLHHVEVADLLAAYETAHRWYRDRQWLLAQD